jgi:hypothetical protein
MGKRFVLIHGAWHGGWCWDKVIAELEARGHTAEAPTMPGMNPGDDCTLMEIDGGHETLWLHPDRVAEALIRGAG